MDHGHEAHEPAGRAPQQVADLILDDHPALAVDGAIGLFIARQLGWLVSDSKDGRSPRVGKMT
jgi:hypothetical protein